MSDAEEKEITKKSRDRSPNHPVASLPDAVEKAGQIREKYGNHQVPIAHVHKLWGYKEHSGKGNQQVAALKAFGLINVSGSAKDRKVSISEKADRIVRGAPDREQLLKKAALSPPIYAELLDEYKDNGLPPDDLLKQYLVWEREDGTFNEDVVDKFIENFRATLAYAGIASDGTIIDGEEPEDTEVAVGSYVQWTSQGVDQFNPPRRVVEISECGEWAKVEGSETGVEVSELSVVDPPADPVVPPTPPAAEPQGGSKPRTANPFQAKPTGPSISFPLSGGNNFTLQLDRPISRKDFERIKKLIDLSEDSLIELDEQSGTGE